jgi:predicted RNA-binding protein with PUA-like domain
VSARKHWLFKSNPGSYSIDDLARDGVTGWDGVRNFQARNLLRDEMSPGDQVLIYHSSVDPMAIVGLAEIEGEARPDETAFEKGHHHYDPKSLKSGPTWFLRDVRYVETFPVPLERALLAEQKELKDMMLLRRGARLSVQPVTPAEFKAVMALARKVGKAGVAPTGKGRKPPRRKASRKARKSAR